MRCDCDDMPRPHGPMMPFWGFSEFTPTIPKLYWNVESQEQSILNLFDLLDKLICYANKLGLQINANAEDIKKLREAFEELREGKFWNLYEREIQKWLTENMERLLHETLLQFVWVTINDEGYLVLHIPDSWNDIEFDFGYVYGRTDYGRIILRYDVDNAITNSYSYNLSSTHTLEQLVADLERTARRGDASYDTLFTNVDKVVKRNAD